MPMSQGATKPDPQPVLIEGWVETTINDQLRVTTEQGRYAARKAASCLLMPKPGDQVLLSIHSASVYVLAVLEQADPEASQINLPGEASIRAGSNLHLSATQALSCASQTLSVGAEQAEISIERTQFIGHLVALQAERIRSVFSSADQIYRRLSQRMVEYFRATQEHEETQANSSRKLVEEDLSLQSRNTHIISEENVKVDGELVQLG